MKHLAKNIYIKCDEYNYEILAEKQVKTGKRAGEFMYSLVGYYSNPSQVSKKIADMGLREVIDKDLKAGMDFVNSAHKNFLTELRKLKSEGKKL